RSDRDWSSDVCSSDLPSGAISGVLERAPEIAPDGLVLALRVEALRYRTEERACAGRVELFGAARDARGAAGYESLELRRGARVQIGRASCRERVWGGV